MARFPPMGVAAVVDGVNDFLKDVGKMSDATDGFMDDAGSKADTLSGRFANLPGPLGKIAGGLASIPAPLLAVGGAAVIGGAAVTGLAIGLGKLAMESASVYDIENAFNQLNRELGADPAEKLQELRDATRGLLPASKLQQIYNEGVATMGDRFADLVPLLPMVVDRAIAMGKDPLQAVNDFKEAISKGSTELLDNLGIVVKTGEANEAYAAQLGKSVDELTASERQVALLNASQDQLNATSALYPNAADTATGAMASLSATMTDAKETIGKALVPVIQELAPVIADLAEQVLPPLVEVFKSDIAPAIINVAKWLGENLPVAIEKTRAFIGEKLLPFLKRVSDGIKFWTGLLRGLYTIIKTRILFVFDFWKVRIENLIQVVQNVIQFFKDLVSNIKTGAQTIFDAVSSLIPDWLKPGSASPLEISLGNVRKQMADLAKLQMAAQVNPVMAAAAVGGVGGSTTTNAPNFNMTINTRAPVEPIVADFRMMAALARRR